jgi:1-acyl-sn-glycerol-3-phosphate acyltransferase
LLAAARAAALLGWLTYCLVPHLVTLALRRPSGWPPYFLGGCAKICGADVQSVGAPVAPHTLLLSNHVSWLDIFVLSGITGCAFVSKAEMGDNRLVKWLADLNNTLYVRRSDRRAIGDQVAEIASALAEHDQPLAIFPEGTVGTECRLLPFRPSLLAAAAPPPVNVTVRPVAIDYGPVFPELGWGEGEHGIANAVRLLGRHGRFPVTVRLLDPLPPTADRKVLARQAFDSVAGALAPSCIVPAAL